MTDRSARRWLARMGEELRTGWPALADPGLRGQFEQHLGKAVETIREQEDGLDRAVPVTQLVLLACHAYDVRQQASRAEWRPPATESGWTADDWYGLRLLACYELASREPGGPRPPRRQRGLSSIVGLIRGSRPA